MQEAVTGLKKEGRPFVGCLYGGFMSDSLVIIDVTAQLFRMYFGKMRRLSPKNLEIGGVWGVCTVLRKVLQKMKPTQFVAVFDSGSLLRWQHVGLCVLF